LRGLHSNSGSQMPTGLYLCSGSALNYLCLRLLVVGYPLA
jgi:hypothetical protein